MSDDTTDTHVDSSEPSMEDILASIRRIIADEDVNSNVEEVLAADALSGVEDSFAIVEEVSADTGEDTLETLDLAEEMDVSAELPDVTAIGDTDTNSDIDLMLSDLDDGDAVDVLDLDMLEAEAPMETQDAEKKTKKLTGLSAIAAAGLGAVASAGVATAKGVTEARKSPTPKSMDDSEFETLDLMMEEVDMSASTDVESDLGDFLTIPDSDSSQAEDDIDALLGDMFMEPDESVTDPAAHLLEDDEAAHDELLADILGEEVSDVAEMQPSAQQPEDIDLVKSLMADLTDDPFEEVSAEENLSESALVDDILSLSIEDETALQSITSAAQGDVDSQVDSLLADVDSSSSSEGAPSALSEIAQAAEADAERHERGHGFAAAGFAAAAGTVMASAGPIAAVVGEAKTNTESEAADRQEAEDIFADMNPGVSVDAEPSISESVSETDTQTNPENLTLQETADMPKAAAKKDAIINEITEEATAGAFASLTQIVETQAVVQERGDRIGDLVQEALRPMLKEWLDKNLKGIVEGAVTKEVKRISSGK